MPNAEHNRSSTGCPRRVIATARPPRPIADEAARRSVERRAGARGVASIRMPHSHARGLPGRPHSANTPAAQIRARSRYPDQTGDCDRRSEPATASASSSVPTAPPYTDRSLRPRSSTPRRTRRRPSLSTPEHPASSSPAPIPCHLARRLRGRRLTPRRQQRCRRTTAAAVSRADPTPVSPDAATADAGAVARVICGTRRQVRGAIEVASKRRRPHSRDARPPRGDPHAATTASTAVCRAATESCGCSCQERNTAASRTRPRNRRIGGRPGAPPGGATV